MSKQRLPNDLETTVKVVILGESGVGKTSLIVRYVNKTYHPFLEPTIGAAFFGQTVTLRKNATNTTATTNNNNNNDTTTSNPSSPTVDYHHVHLKIWDTGGQERYHSLAPLYYRGSGAAIFVYDICRLHSFQTLKEWVKELEQHNDNKNNSNNNTNNNNNNNHRVLCLVGNKSDLQESRSVSKQDAMNYANDIGAIYLECSAKDDSNVQALFERLAQRAIEVLPPDCTNNNHHHGTAPPANALFPLNLSSSSSTHARSSCCFGTA